MKRGKQLTIGLLMCALLAGLLSGCGAGGGKTASATEAEVKAEAGSYASETMAAQSQWDGAVMEAEGPPLSHNTEEYNYIAENAFLAVANAPLSTFAADVDTASYANIRRKILEGNEVPADAVRIEEMLNYFTYDYPEPTEGEPFSVTTYIGDCPWNENHKLLQIGLQAEKPDLEDQKPSNLVFLIDVSGSMESADKLGLVKRAFLLLTENLRPEDTVSIVTYASSDTVVLDGVSGEEKAAIMTAIENLTAGGSTDGSKGIETAYRLAEEHFQKDGNNRVILATDGDLNLGLTSEGDLTRLIQKKKESGVFLSVMGFGTGNIKDNKMEALADNGNGQYAYVDSLMEAKRVLVEELGGTLFTVAKDVKLQVEFNPAKVKGYRLIGYENRLMEARDFDDDAKDGGEIGAGHRVTALYELVPAGSDEDLGEVELKYGAGNASAAGNGENGGAEVKPAEGAPAPGADSEWLTLKVRYKEPDGDQSRLLEYPVDDSAVCRELPPDMRFASCVAQTGMLLRDSEYAGGSSYKAIAAELERVDGLHGDPYKEEFLYLVKRLAAM
ncbi:VWA domain-containing protein [Enterocloster lavalensis]|uniref:vWA domain-containing protein n=1 Tax=Enterocloster lavalensis TaxID=460384 RepID=UPI002A816459|nr:VWA domain-containing protein [Enterocloster lavalensis]